MIASVGLRQSGAVRCRLAAWASLALALLGALAGTATAQIPNNVAVTPNIPFAYESTSLAVDPVRPGHIAVAYMEGIDKKACGLALSNDGGATWRAELFLGPMGRFPVPEGFSGCTDVFGNEHGDSPPQVAYGPDGTLYYYSLAERRRPASHRVFISRSSDGGATFSQPKQVDPGATGVADFNQAIALDPESGTIYSTWTRVPCPQGICSYGSQIAVSSSADGGQSFTSPVAASPASQVFHDDSFPVVGPDGAVHVSWVDDTEFLASGGMGGGRLHVASSSDRASSFGAPVSVTKLAGACNANGCDELHYNVFADVHAIAAGRSAGEVFVAWFDRPASGGKYRIHFSASRDAEKSFSEPKVYGIPQGREADEQHRPSLAVAPNGRIDLAYYDITAPDTSGARTHNVYRTYSCDGGRSFSSPEKVTDVASNAAIGPPPTYGGKVAPVGRVGLAASGTRTFVSWTDSRREDPTADDAKQDVFFAGLAAPNCGGLPPGPGQPASPVLPGPDPGMVPGGGAGGGRPGGGDMPGGGGPGAVERCSVPRGRVAARGLGGARLGVKRAGNRRSFVSFARRLGGRVDRFCLTDRRHIRVGYATPALASGGGRAFARRVARRAIVVLTASRRYALRGVRPGAPLGTLRRRVARLGRPFVRGANRWFLVRGSQSRLVFRVRGGRVREVGIANLRLTQGRGLGRRFVRAFR